MCFVFPVRFVNLVVHLTTPSDRAPRVEGHQVRQFLDNVANPDRTRTWTSEGRARLAAAAARSLELLGDVTDAPLAPAELDAALAPVRAVLADHLLFALPAGQPAEADQERHHRWLAHVAAASGTQALILIPDSWAGRQDRTVVDPMPAVELLDRHLDQWPGVLFWSRSGAAAFVGLDAVDAFYRRLDAAYPLGLAALDAVLGSYRPRTATRRLLHLSDLHFGTREARDNLAHLKAQLAREAPALARAVITGDLVQTPRGTADPDFDAFKDFRRWLAGELGSEVVVVPGNHDQRWMGNRLGSAGDNKNLVADLGWAKVVADAALLCVFLCLDSSREGQMARGEVTQAQLDDVAREFDAAGRRQPELRHYRRAVLLHHHPRPYDRFRDRLVDPSAGGGVLDQEALLSLADGERFMAWCRDQAIDLVLHGHKHLQRVRVGEDGEPAIVGCGTSLGAEGKPLSYNVLTFEPAQRRVAVTLHASDGPDAPFRPLAMAIPYL